MSNVVKLKRPRKQTIRGSARECLTDAVRSVKKPQAVAIVVLGEDGTFALRSANLPSVRDFDMYSRAGAIIDRQRMALLD